MECPRAEYQYINVTDECLLPFWNANRLVWLRICAHSPAFLLSIPGSAELAKILYCCAPAPACHGVPNIHRQKNLQVYTVLRVHKQLCTCITISCLKASRKEPQEPYPNPPTKSQATMAISNAVLTQILAQLETIQMSQQAMQAKVSWQNYYLLQPALIRNFS